MKKLLLILMLFFSIIITAQTQMHGGRVKIGTTPTSTEIDTLLSIGTDRLVKQIRFTELYSKIYSKINSEFFDIDYNDLLNVPTNLAKLNGTINQNFGTGTGTFGGALYASTTGGSHIFTSDSDFPIIVKSTDAVSGIGFQENNGGVTGTLFWSNFEGFSFDNKLISNGNITSKKLIDGGVVRVISEQNDASHSTTIPFGSFEVYSKDGSGTGEGVRGAMRVYPSSSSGGGTSLVLEVSGVKQYVIDNIGFNTWTNGGSFGGLIKSNQTAAQITTANDVKIVPNIEWINAQNFVSGSSGVNLTTAQDIGGVKTFLDPTEFQGNIFTTSDFYTRNKSDNAFIKFIDRNTTGSEVVIDFSNIGTVQAETIDAENLDVENDISVGGEVVSSSGFSITGGTVDEVLTAAGSKTYGIKNVVQTVTTNAATISLTTNVVLVTTATGNVALTIPTGLKFDNIRVINATNQVITFIESGTTVNGGTITQLYQNTSLVKTASNTYYLVGGTLGL